MAKKPSLAETALRPTGRNRAPSIEELIRAVQQPAVEPAAQPRVLAIDQLHRGRYQPRHIVDEQDAELLELADSIRTLGLIEPIAVRPLEQGHYEILAGDRRWRAARLAGLTEVAVIVHPVDDRTAAAMALVENLQRQDLNPIEAAAALQRLRADFQLSQEQLGRLLGLSKSAISRTLGFLSLPAEVQTLLSTRQLDAGHAKVLLNLPPEVQMQLSRQAVAKGWSVRELENRKAALDPQTALPHASADPPSIAPDFQRLEPLLSTWLAAPVRFAARKAGKGCITIHFANAAECTSILRKMGFDPEQC